MALPGQTFINGVSNFMFGTNMPPDFVPNTVRNTPQIQARIKAGGFTLMRVAFASTDTDAFIDSKVNACIACGCAVLAILTRSSATFNQHLVQYLGSRCNLYEFTNEPDLNGWDVNTYITNWNSQIPTLRGLNPNAAFMGPALGVVANFESYLRPFLQACENSGVIPDAVSFHSYPCTNTNDAVSCAPRAVNIGVNDVVACRNIIQSVFGFSLPVAVTEWNIDASSPPRAYTQDAQFNATWTKSALKSMVDNGCEIACQFDAASGAGNGLLDLVSTTSPYPARVQYQPMVDSIQTYLNPNTGGSNPRLVGPDTPTGLTLGTKDNSGINPNLIPAMKEIGLRWFRWQPYSNSIEKSRGVYSWGNLDGVVQQCNAAGINLLVTVLFPPAWGISNGVPSPSWTLDYASALCERYDGKHGHGIIQGVELGNEDYDMGANRPFAPLAATMNMCYPPLKQKYPDLVIGPGSTLQRNATHIKFFWDGMWSAAGGKWDYLNHHYYTCLPGGSRHDPSDNSIPNVPSFAACMDILIGCNTRAGKPNFPIWITETGFAINSNFGYPTNCITNQQKQSDYMLYCLNDLKSRNKPSKYFWFNISFLSIQPSSGQGTSQGMSLYQGIPGQGGAKTIAYNTLAAYPKNWGGGGGGPTTTTAIKDYRFRVGLRSGANTGEKNYTVRAPLKEFDGTFNIKDYPVRAGLEGAITDTFVRSNQSTWGTASGGLQWLQAGGTAVPSIVSNRGRITGAGGVTTMRLGAGTLLNAEALVRMSVSRAGDIIGVNLRDRGLNEFYRLRLTSSQLQIAQQNASAFTILTSTAFAVSPNVNYWMKFRVLNNDLKGKIWADGTIEPDWMISANSSGVTNAGQVGLSILLTQAADIVQFDSYSVTEAAQFLPPPQQSQRDFMFRAGLEIPSFTQKRSFPFRARLFDPDQITVFTFAAKRPPLLRKFPKS